MSLTNRRWIAAVVFLSLLLVVLTATYALVRRQVKNWQPRLVEYVRLQYGVDCELSALDYAFPDGLRASGLRIAMANRPLLEAAEATFRIRLFRFLKHRSLHPRLLKSLRFQGLKLHLRRLPSGEWFLPAPGVPSRLGGDTPGGHAAGGGRTTADHIRISIRDLALDITTSRGSLQRRYDRLDAAYDPAAQTGRLSLHGGTEKMEIDFRAEPERRVTIKADALGLQPLLLFTSAGLPLDRVFLRGHAEFRESPAGEIALQAAGEIFARAPDEALNVRLTMEGSGTGAGWNEIRGELTFGGEKVLYSFRTDRKGKPVVRISLVFPDFSFERFIAALPRSFYPHLPELQVTGHLRGVFAATVAAAPPYRTAGGFTGEATPLRVLALGPRIRIGELKKPFRHTFRTAEGKPAAIFVGPENPDFIPYAAIPPRMIRAVITAEDGGFFRHRGISINQIIEATADNIRAGRVVRGASTITMQLAKNLYLSRERTFSRKFEELFITLALEQELSKQRIMEIYLNIIEWGEGIYGLVPAARHYFRKSPGELTDRECAFLASIIARPTDDWPEDPLGGVSAGWQQYLDLIVRKMGEKEIPAPEGE